MLHQSSTYQKDLHTTKIRFCFFPSKWFLSQFFQGPRWATFITEVVGTEFTISDEWFFFRKTRASSWRGWPCKMWSKNQHCFLFRSYHTGRPIVKYAKSLSALRGRRINNSIELWCLVASAGLEIGWISVKSWIFDDLFHK